MQQAVRHIFRVTCPEISQQLLRYLVTDKGKKNLFQESKNSAKPDYIYGHMFGGSGILAGRVRIWAYIPLSIRLHGLQTATGWKGASVSATSHVAQMMEDAYRATLAFVDSLLLPDRYFLTVPALEKLMTIG